MLETINEQLKQFLPTSRNSFATRKAVQDDEISPFAASSKIIRKVF
jgi:hypothetical protein